MKQRSNVARAARRGPPTVRTATPRAGTQAVARTLALLTAFRDDAPQWRLSDLARAVGLTKPTAHRLLGALEHARFIARDQAGDAYRLGPEAIALGARALRSNGLRAASRAELEALAGDVGETVTLEILADRAVVCVDEVQGRSLIGTAPSVGARWAAHASSTGKVLLAALPPAERRAHLAAGSRLEAFTDRTITSHEALKAELQRVAKQGWAVAAEELEVGYTALAVPVRNYEGETVAAISVGGPSTRMTAVRRGEILPRLRETGERVSRALGCPC
jgi:DNA-binding IclR family transcriptional regulator